ncbi:kinase-like domain-containing protein [Rhizophagus clarus]|uniref:Kinase-like domain-containing protein n=1 Tax=Rhizophagus clarus TaxID=94130 RepID=A0A8H3LW37_9GLOM|nr:kinase-like domain-containing protein [Rhizophagus clarus]
MGLRNYKANQIIHSDINPNNILIHKQEIKLADFGCSRQQEDKVSTRRRGTIPYVDPKFFYGICDLTEKSDIYSLALVFWELTSCRSSFDYEAKKNNLEIMLKILNGKRENPIPNTNKCWKCEPDERPNICKVISDLNSIDSIKSENDKLSTNCDSRESGKNASMKELEGQDLSNCEKECDLNSGEYLKCNIALVMIDEYFAETC